MAQSRFPIFDRSAIVDQPLGKQPSKSSIDSPKLSVTAQQELLAISGVNGFGFESDRIMIVYLSNSNAMHLIPKEIEGFSVKLQMIGSVHIF